MPLLFSNFLKNISISLTLSPLSSIVPCSTSWQEKGYPLTGFLSALILQKIFSIPTDSLLILLLSLCRELRDFCGFHKEEFHLSKALTPYNHRNESTLKKVIHNAYGYPTCPKDSTLDMKYARHCHEKGRSDRDKWVCPKVHMVNKQWVCNCKEPCRTAKKGRTTYT